MRLAGKQRLGYFPLPPPEAKRLRRFLSFPDNTAQVLDPCAGTGAALVDITDGAKVMRHGVELDSFRARDATRRLDHVIQGNCFDVHSAVESYSLLVINPPYDFEIGDSSNRRLEALFLEHCYRWLKPGGVLVFVIPATRVCDCAQALSVHFRDKAIYRLTAAESVRYQQVAIFGVRRSRQERDRLTDHAEHQARLKLQEMTRRFDVIPPLPNQPDRMFTVPAAEKAELHHRGLPLDQVEDLLANSPAWKQAMRILVAPQARLRGRPVTPLHQGHVAILAIGGCLNNCFGAGEDRHVACWETGRITDRFEETDESGVTTIRERQRFTQTLTLLYSDGEATILKEARDGERSSAGGQTEVHQAVP